MDEYTSEEVGDPYYVIKFNGEFIGYSKVINKVILSAYAIPYSFNEAKNIITILKNRMFNMENITLQKRLEKRKITVECQEVSISDIIDLDKKKG